MFPGHVYSFKSVRNPGIDYFTIFLYNFDFLVFCSDADDISSVLGQHNRRVKT